MQMAKRGKDVRLDKKGRVMYDCNGNMVLHYNSKGFDFMGYDRRGFDKNHRDFFGVEDSLVQST